MKGKIHTTYVTKIAQNTKDQLKKICVDTYGHAPLLVIVIPPVDTGGYRHTAPSGQGTNLPTEHAPSSLHLSATWR